MKIGTCESKKGEIAYGKITVGYTMGRFPIDIPIVIAQGLEDGPTMTVSGCVHGGELLGVMGIHELLHHVDPRQMKGTIIFVPIANQSAFEFGERSTVWDGQNLNREGLGKPDGTITQQTAHHFTSETVLKSDAFVDIHSGTPDGFVWYSIYRATTGDVDPAVIDMSKKMAVAFGLKEIMGKTPDRWAGGYMVDVLRRGVPSITIEIGGGGDYLLNGKQQIEMCAQGIRNVAILLGILDGDIVVETEEMTVFEGDGEIIASGKGGLLRTDVQIGDFLKKDSVWGILYDPFTGLEIERYLTPHDCYQLASFHPWPAVHPGSALAVLGNPMFDAPLKVREVLAGFNVRVGGAYKTGRA